MILFNMVSNEIKKSLICILYLHKWQRREVIRQLKYGRRRLNARPSDGSIVRLLESSDERVDWRVTNTGGLNDCSGGTVEDEDGNGTKEINIVEIVRFTLKKQVGSQKLITQHNVIQTLRNTNDQ
jgi:hypothetical protein